VVDDKYFARFKLISVFDQKVHQVLEAENGIAAIQIYKDERPDIVFCDLIMPEMDGITTLNEMKKINPDVVLIIVTSLGVQSVLIEALANGAKEVILKPFEEEHVLNIFHRYIK